MSEPANRRQAAGTSRGAVLITGASSGIGRACATALAGAGFVVYAGVRRSEDAELVSVSRNIHSVFLDITRDDELRSVGALIEKELPAGGFSGIVNSAGICVACPLEFVGRETFRDQLEVNVISQLAVIQQFLPLLRRFQGRIVNIGSISGRIAGSLYGPYSASKFALEAVSAALRAEIGDAGISVSIVVPGSVSTPFWSKTVSRLDGCLAQIPEEARRPYQRQIARRRAAMLRHAHHAQSADTVAGLVVRAMTTRSPRARYVIGWDTKMKCLAADLIPRALWSLMAGRLAR